MTASKPSAAARVALAQAAIFAVALALRLWGGHFGDTAPEARPDESTFAVQALALWRYPFSMLTMGWPSGYFRLWALVLRAEQLAWPDANLGCLLSVQPVDVLFPMRALSALFGALTALVVGRLAARLAGERAGLIAAAAYAVNLLTGRDGHFGVSDALLTLGVALCLWACTAAAEGRPRWLPLAGACAAGSLGVKYSAAPLALPCLLALWQCRRQPRALHWGLAGLAAAVAALFAASPEVFFSPREAWAGLVAHGVRYEMTGPLGLFWYSGFALPEAMGFAGLAFALGGAAVVLRRRAGPALPALGFACVFFFAVLGPLRWPFGRYASPLVVVLAALAGLGVDALVERLPTLARPWVLSGALLLVLVPPAVRLVRFDQFLGRRDTRDLAFDWLVARGEPIERRGGWGQVNALEKSAQDACRPALPSRLQRELPIAAGESRPWARAVRSGDRAVGLLGGWLRETPATPAPALLAAISTPPWLPLEMAAPCWEEVARFDPGTSAARFDAQDDFFAPLGALPPEGRPGPLIAIRRYTCGPR